ncbi:polysaccharide deacetylase family protein [Belnapia moabensis]|uniref:polysaccharide deacetylase family protein n=1 Tax=Belnapia moabensis TaxID=365533 RepID=UPI000A03296C
METHFAYGSRGGIWRILGLFNRFGVKATFSCCGRAVAVTPVLAAVPAAAGHEVSAHGWRWEMLAGMPEAQERTVMAARPSATVATASGANAPPYGTGRPARRRAIRSPEPYRPLNCGGRRSRKAATPS